MIPLQKYHRLENSLSFAKQSILVFLCCLLIMYFVFTIKAYADPYQQGNIRSWISAGRSEAFDDEYFLLGYGIGFFPIEYLELGIEGSYWLGETPSIQKIGIQAQYILPVEAPVKPYAGILYRNTLVSGIGDMTAYGFRAGLYYSPGDSFILGLSYSDLK